MNALAHQGRALAARAERQELGLHALTALNAVVRNARTHGEVNDVFAVSLTQLGEVVERLVAQDGFFELRRSETAFYLNRQALRLDANQMPMAAVLRHELDLRDVVALTARAPLPEGDRRALVRMFGPKVPPLEPTGLADAPFEVLRLELGAARPSGTATHAAIDERLADAYGRAAFFICRHLELLRSEGTGLPTWAASHLAMELVDLQQLAPLRFLQLSRTRAGGDAYWGVHGANVTVLAVTLAAAARLPKRERHGLAMAGLFHDVGLASVPAELLAHKEPLGALELARLRATPFFAVRTFLRERETHAAALARAVAVFECHLDDAAAEGNVPPAAEGRLIRLCEKFDALTTDRPFRAARPPREAVATLMADPSFPQPLVALFAQVLWPLTG